MHSSLPRPAPSNSEVAAARPASGAIQDRKAWLVRIDDLMVDARTLPRDMQEELAEAGHIPCVPAEAEG